MEARASIKIAISRFLLRTSPRSESPVSLFAYKTAATTHHLKKELHRVAEQTQAVAFLGEAQAGPARMLRRQDVALRVRHQAEYPAAGIAQSGDVALGTAGIARIGAGPAAGIPVAEHDLAGLVQALQDPRLPAHEITFAVRDR